LLNGWGNFTNFKSNNKSAIHIIAGFGSMMLHFVMPITAEMIET